MEVQYFYGVKTMIKKIFNNIICPTCIFYTIISLFIGVTSFTLDRTIPAIPISNLLVIAAFSLFLSIINLIFKIKTLNVYIRIPIHYIVSTVSLYLVLLIAAGDIVTNTKNIRLVMLLMYSIVYVITTVVYICIKETRKKPKTTKSEDYEKIYK